MDSKEHRLSISRRKFLVGMLLAIPLVKLSWTAARKDYAPGVALLVQESLSDLELEAAGLAKFAHDFVAHHPKNLSKAGLFSLAVMLRGLPLLGPRLQTRLDETRTMAAERYLLSSNYFTAGYRKGEPVSYIQYYDPYERPCTNPLARFT